MPYENTTSEELMRLVAKGDRMAFSCLMERHRKTVYGIVYRYFHSQQDADDMFQEVFLKIWRSAGSYTPTAKFRTWLYTITANQCKGELALFWHKGVRLVGTFWGEGQEEWELQGSPSTEEKVAHDQQTLLVRNAILMLPAKQRLALILNRFEGLSYKEIAEVMHCSVPTVESLLFRAKSNLKQMFSSSAW